MDTATRQDKMELDQALEFAVVSSWDELVHPGEPYSIHVEYKNSSELPLTSVEVWMIKKRGYGCLVFRYSLEHTASLAPSSEAPGMHFANSYTSNILAANLDFIMRHQNQFSRPVDHSIHGLVQIDAPSEEERASAAAWWQSGRTILTGESGALAHPLPN
jgi:hypothetical protein